MLSRLVLSAALLVILASVSMAQVEFEVDPTKDPYRTAFQGLTDAEKTVVNFLYLTQKDEFCISDIYATKQDDAEIIVCVFQDPTNPQNRMLHIPESQTARNYFLEHVLIYEGRVAAVFAHPYLPGRATLGVGNLPDGSYALEVYDREWTDDPAVDLLTTISFTIGDKQDTTTRMSQ